MADRQEFQQERTRLLRDPEAGDNTQYVEPGYDEADVQSALETADAIEGAEAYEPEQGENPAPRPVSPELAAARPEVEVTAAIVDDGIAVTFLIPHGLIGVALSE